MSNDNKKLILTVKFAFREQKQKNGLKINV